MTVELVVFDCDGVLVDSEALVIEIEAKLLTDAGFPVTTDELADNYVGLAYSDMMASLADRFGRPVPNQMATTIMDAALAAFPTELRPVDGMPEFLETLTLPRCLASSSAPERIDLSLEVTGIGAHFDAEHRFSATMVERGKPAPDLFLHAAANLGTAPENCVVIEDSPHGVMAAVAAGMPVIGFTGGAHARPSLADRLRDAGAATVVDHPSRIVVG